MRNLLVLSLLAAGSCAMTPPNGAAAPPNDIPVHGADPAFTCRDEEAPEFIGQTATAALGAKMLARTGAKTIRWVPHGAMITMEFSPSRLTVRLDQQNRVADVNCG